MMDANLEDATKKDQTTRTYFDALLAGDLQGAQNSSKEIYLSMKTAPMAAKLEIDLAFVIDVTGSMGPYARTMASTIKTLVGSQGVVMKSLAKKFAKTQFTLRVAAMGFRDVDDGAKQFEEKIWQSNSHFTDDSHDAMHWIDSITCNTSGGGDFAEDSLGAIKRCVSWSAAGDWESRIKFMMLFTDAPAHGLVPSPSIGIPDTMIIQFATPRA
jgi:hypothetical protein